MPLLIDPPKTYNTIENPMDEGFNNAVVSKIEDLGMVAVNPMFLAQKRAEAQKNGRDPASVSDHERKIRITYTADDGTEAAEEVTGSLHEKATLAKRIKAITGEAPTAATDIEVLLNAPVVVQVETKVAQKSGREYPKVVAVAARKAEAGKKATKPAAAAAAADLGITDEDVPF